MKKENIVGFRVSLYECNNPQQFYKNVRPDNCIDELWLAQTIGDQIWIWFEFANKKDKKEYIKQLKAKKMKVLAPKWPSQEKDKYYDPIDWFMHDEKWLNQESIDRWTSDRFQD